MFTYHQPAPISAMFAESRFGTFVDDALISTSSLTDATGMRLSDVVGSEYCCIDIKIKNHFGSKRSKTEPWRTRYRHRNQVLLKLENDPQTKPKETTPKYLLVETFPHGKTCRSIKVFVHETQRWIKRRRWAAKDAHDSWVLILDTVFLICCFFFRAMNLYFI